MSIIKKLLIIFLVIICISIALGVYINTDNPSTNSTVSNDGTNDIVINDSISHIINNSDENGTIWVEYNGTLKEVKVGESSGNVSASN
ncbi:hypothetical protein [Methanobrevibacter olleyae]|uniref:Uncharacterized protein n=1 Tax=Methanobrevibacter olleyae TaxID=294671 RepID=A0A126R095_METOL|nr:hypothetical protein [Methanobrevibacter olleyae]AMK15379.1 hypothetical protein YLM1_0822 [Methanobrevibacter olleyae]SFL49114.1 hypothetical protein SAMN02910297_01038 [Methanobrevibacter olleyae]